MDRRPSGLWIIAAGLFALAAVAGAWGDWILWKPYSGIMITIAAIAVLIVAGIFALIPRRRARQIGLLVGAVAIGGLAGQNLGPARPALTVSEGQVTVALTSPRGATGTASVTCEVNGEASELSMWSDPNLRLDILAHDPAAPADVDQRAFVTVGVSVGDRWIDGPSPRPDTVVVGAAISGTMGKDAAETRMTSNRDSSIDLTWSAAGGTVRFAGLVRDTRYAEAVGDPIDVAGTITWTCGR
jgi:hypothetical protein